MANHKISHFAILFLACIFLASKVAANTWNDTISTFNLQGVFQSIFCGKGTCQDNTQCQKNRLYISSLEQSGFYDVRKEPIINNRYKIKEVTFSDIQTKGYFQWENKAQNGFRKMSGLLVLPETDQPIRGIVVSFHGTLFSKNQVPSNHISFNAKYRASGAIFASHNLAVLFPDYPGLGSDAKNVHPYVVYPQQNIRAAIYLLNAALPLLQDKYPSARISKQNPLPVFSTGYSEGGAYGVWFGACNTPSLRDKYTYCTKDLSLQKDYKVVGISGSAGGYDSDLGNQYETSNVDGSGQNYYKIGSQLGANSAKPGFTVLSLYAYATYNPKPLKLSQILVKQFYNMQCSADIQSKDSCTINGHPHMNMQQALSLDDSDFLSISNAILYSALSKKNNGITYLSGQNWPTQTTNSFLALLHQEVLFTQEFYKAYNSSSIVTFGNITPFPTFIYSLNQDSMVTPLHSEHFIKNNNGKVKSYFLNSTIFQTCDTNKYTKTDHVGGYAVSSIFVLNFFEQVLKNLKLSNEEL